MIVVKPAVEIIDMADYSDILRKNRKDRKGLL